MANKIQNSKNNPARSSSMAQLMAAHKSPFVTLRKGDSVKGIITKLSPSEILVDIHAKTDALVLEKDKRIARNLISILKVGDTVVASVLNPESDMGYPVISLRRFLDDIVWEKLAKFVKEQKSVRVNVSGTTRGGFLVSFEDGIAGFLPNSQAVFIQNPEDLVGENIDVFVIELNRPSRKIIVSQKKMINKEEFEKIVKKTKIGQKINTTIATITPFGMFTTIVLPDGGSVDGLVHISEISWEKIDKLDDKFTVGQRIEAEVLAIDNDNKRLDLSVKRLMADPFEKLIEGISLEAQVKGKVKQITSAGLLVTVKDGIEGLIRKEKIPPTVSYEVGQEITATVSQIDKKRRRIILTPVLKEKPIGYR